MIKFYCLVFSILIKISVVRGTLKEKELGTKLQDLAKMLHITCVGKSGTDEATISKIINGDFVDDPKIKMDDQGELNTKAMIDMLPPNLKENAAKLLETCGQKTKDISNLDEKAFTLFKCVYDNNPATFIFF